MCSVASGTDVKALEATLARLTVRATNGQVEVEAQAVAGGRHPR